MLAGYDVSRYHEILHWPVGEALAAYEHKLREQARREYEVSVQIWATLAPHSKKKSKPPELPAILK